MDLELWEVTYTDTFGGNPNWSWKETHTFTSKPGVSTRVLMRKAKALVGLTGIRGVTEDNGTEISFVPDDRPTILFITYSETGSAEEIRDLLTLLED